MNQNKLMYFHEIASILGICPKTLRTLIRAHSDKSLIAMCQKKGSGSYFYNAHEVQLILSTFNKN